MSANRVLLEQRLQQLIKSTGWAEDKQRAWLDKTCGLSDWHDCDETELEQAVNYLERFDKMFQSPLDTVSSQHNTGKSREERESLRIYLGEGEEE